MTDQSESRIQQRLQWTLDQRVADAAEVLHVRITPERYEAMHRWVDEQWFEDSADYLRPADLVAQWTDATPTEGHTAMPEQDTTPDTPQALAYVVTDRDGRDRQYAATSSYLDSGALVLVRESADHSATVALYAPGSWSSVARIEGDKATGRAS